MIITSNLRRYYRALQICTNVQINYFQAAEVLQPGYGGVPGSKNKKLWDESFGSKGEKTLLLPEAAL